MSTNNNTLVVRAHENCRKKYTEIIKKKISNAKLNRKIFLIMSTGREHRRRYHKY